MLARCYGLLRGAEEVDVGSPGEGWVFVTELVGDERGVAALGDQDRGERVAQRVKGDAGQLSPLHRAGQTSGRLAG